RHRLAARGRGSFRRRTRRARIRGTRGSRDRSAALSALETACLHRRSGRQRIRSVMRHLLRSSRGFLFTTLLAAAASAGQSTTRVSVRSNGVQAAQGATFCWLSPDGRAVAFLSDSPDLVVGDTNGRVDGFLHDRFTGTTVRVSLGDAGAPGDGDCTGLSLTPDLRFAVFTSLADDLVPGDTNGRQDVFVRDL